MNILITGASKGVGFELALQLAEQGHDVLALARSVDRLNELQNRSENANGSILALSIDIVNDDLSEKLIPEIDRYFEKLDVLVNNAGALVNKDFNKLTEEDMDLMMHTNVKAPFFLIRILKPYLKSGSHIVNIGSMGGVQGSAKFPGLSVYSASKGALAVLTECLAEEFKEEGIKVNCLALGAAQTEMLEKAFPGYQAPLSAASMAEFIADFSVHGSKYFNGKIVPVSVSTP
ncbi:MAG: SDR family oxidoreductase [Bacteroidales bacterium]|nr:SDR family oxidoreductase [Bacteroidales bacterium]MCF8386376.1 SDR family oxidoreductase [Bacteroidales bacterium]MCF8396782.1 SDR family oxidoreductase [Bacteroidales bacterium]